MTTKAESCFRTFVSEDSLSPLKNTVRLTNFEAWSTFKDLETLKVFSRIHVLRGLCIYLDMSGFSKEENNSPDFLWAPHTSDFCLNGPYFPYDHYSLVNS